MGDKKIIKAADNKYRIAFYVLGIIVLIIYHMAFNLNYGDVVNTYGNVLKRGSEYFPENAGVFDAIYNFTKFHYLNWSSRNIIEIVLIVVGRLPVICWHVLDILMVILIGYSIDQLIHIKNQKMKYMSIFTLLMMYQVVTMGSAGWIATTINYSWVAAAGLYVILGVQRIRTQEKVTVYSYIMLLIAAAFATNHEQMNGFLLLVLSGALIWDIAHKKFKKSLLPVYIINIVEFIVICTCPGNQNRRNVETVSYYPDYAQFRLTGKLYAGMSDLLKGLFDICGIVFITVTLILILIYLSFYNKKNITIKILSIVPFLYCVLKYSIRALSMLEFSRLGDYFVSYRLSFKATLLGCLILVLMLIVCCFNIDDMSERIGTVWLLSSAAATKVVLGFSVAFLVSGERTSIYMAFVLIAFALYMIQRNEDVFTPLLKKKIFIIGVCCLNLALFMWNYCLIYKGIVF